MLSVLGHEGHQDARCDDRNNGAINHHMFRCCSYGGFSSAAVTLVSSVDAVASAEPTANMATLRPDDTEHHCGSRVRVSVIAGGCIEYCHAVAHSLVAIARQMPHNHHRLLRNRAHCCTPAETGLGRSTLEQERMRDRDVYSARSDETTAPHEHTESRVEQCSWTHGLL